MKTSKQIKNSDFEQLSADYVEAVKSKEANAYQEDEDLIWKSIEAEVQQQKRKKATKKILFSLSTAACLLLILGGAYLLFLQKSAADKQSNLFDQQPVTNYTLDKITLFTADNKTVLIDAQTSLEYDKDGNTQVNSKPLGKPERKEGTLNQIIVPKGKQMNLQFSDGTKMIINSNSRVFFPAVFDENERKIFVDGEVFLDVVKDNNRPFIVETSNLTLLVRGTSFNVNSYSKEGESTVVLVSGKVEVAANNEKTAFTLSPNQLFRVKGRTTETKKVDAFAYTCWTQNRMMFDQTPLDQALHRLSDYYGQEIVLKVPLNSIPLNGKIDLKNSLKDVLDIIEATAPVTFTFQDGLIYVHKKQK